MRDFHDHESLPYVNAGCEQGVLVTATDDGT